MRQFTTVIGAFDGAAAREREGENKKIVLGEHSCYVNLSRTTITARPYALQSFKAKEVS